MSLCFPRDCPDELPIDNFCVFPRAKPPRDGNDDEEEEEEDYDEDVADSAEVTEFTHLNHHVRIGEAEYECGTKLKYIVAELYTEPGGTRLGILDAWWIERSNNPEFFSMVDYASGELQEVAVLCCNPNGTLRTPVSSVIGNKQRVTAAGKGGFVYINELHVAKDHLGFVQVKDSGFWFIERSQLKEADVNTSNLEVVRDEPVAERPKLEGINLSLFELAGVEQSFQVFESLVRNGASIDTTCSMHKAAALGLLKNVTLFIKLGGNVNHKDEFGNTPLHVAVLELKPEIISLLVKNGADVNIASKKGSKPVDLLESTLQSTTDFLLTFGMDNKITAEKAKFAAIKQLLVSPKKQRTE